MNVLISVDQAQSLIEQYTPGWGVETVSLLESSERILSEDIYADRDFPPYDRVTMDGFALGSIESQLIVQDIQLAGQKPKEVEVGKAIEIMTGSVLPKNAVTVVPYEKITSNLQTGTISLNDDVKQSQNIHFAGSDAKKGDVLIKKGTTIRAPQQAILASCGRSSVLCDQRPSVAIVSTGDELVDIERTPEDHQIRSSNLWMLRCQMQVLGLAHCHIHLKDDPDDLETEIKALSRTYDVIILSGGVSKGKADHVVPSLEKAGFRKVFHGVAQRPGKPLLFAEMGPKMAFGLPGNPMAAMVSFFRYIKPVLCQQKAPADSVVLAKDFQFTKPFAYFLQVRLEPKNEITLAYPLSTNGSGDMVQALSAMGFIELPANRTAFKVGEKFPLFRFTS